jgi:hypothetical protein
MHDSGPVSIKFAPSGSAPPSSKIFLLGVGCQKGGTTWLHDYLSHHPNADMGFRKEYHVFDARHLPSCRNFIEAETACGHRMLEWFSKTRTNPGDSTVLDFYADIEAYYEYFAHLAHRRADVRVVGDMTPSYAGLPASVLASVRESLGQHGLTVRVIFLMRDPVDRIWSAARMIRRNRRLTSLRDADVIRSLYRTASCELRTRYDETIRNLEAAFPAEAVLYQFYESLFSADQVREITDFLELPFVEPDTAVRFNASPKTQEVSENLQREIVSFYRPVYEFCSDRFGADVIHRLWPSARFLPRLKIARAA